jgi:translation initiation factor 2B subunit (eIF-2B alpha/beta/delta family)
VNKFYNESDNVTDEIHKKLASNINLSLRKRHSKKYHIDVLEKFHRPANVINMSVSKVNIELWEDVHQNLRKKDMNLSKNQGLILTACSSVVAQKCLTKQKKRNKNKRMHKCICLFIGRIHRAYSN